MSKNIKRNIFSFFTPFDRCKKCGATRYECKHCLNNEFYRHEDDKETMKYTMRLIRVKKAGYLEWVKRWRAWGDYK